MLEEKELEVLGPKPTIYDTLPFQSVRLCKYLAINIPLLPWTLHNLYKDFQEEKAEQDRIKKEELEEFERREKEKIERKNKKKEQRKKIVYDEKEGESSDPENSKTKAKKEEIFKLPKNANQMWTDADLAKLAKLIKKYPAGQ